MQFVSARGGWMIGGPEEFSGIGARDDTQLWRTRDGGNTWNPVPVPVPKDSPEQGTYLITLKFKDDREGVVAAGVERSEGGATFRFVSCFTFDSGKTWKSSEFEAQDAQPSPGNKHVFWSADYVEGLSDIRMDSKPIPFALPAQASSSEALFTDIDFWDDSNAWLRYGERLIATTDRGKTSTFIWPPRN
jgi:hypothetical protein